ncbi:hypothetical protein I315_02914 [Cryptococcus gattii Ru294]|nr:hypothetical protein I315_02914 [Cryptococcus gattii Ru294]
MMKEKSKIQYLPLFIYLPGTRLPSMSIASTPLSSYDKNRYRIVKFVDGRQESLTSLPPPPQRDVIIQLDIDRYLLHASFCNARFPGPMQSMCNVQWLLLAITCCSCPSLQRPRHTSPPVAALLLIE